MTDEREPQIIRPTGISSQEQFGVPRLMSSLTIRFEGSVPIEDLKSAFGRFADLVSGLTKEIAPGAHIRWIVTELEGGSATATATAETETDEDRRLANEVIRAYGDVGRTLEAGRPLAFAPRITRAATGLRSLIDGDIQSIQFSTDEAEAIIVATEPQVGQAMPRVEAFGAVTGRVEVLSSRRNLRFTMWDVFFDRPVSCYLAPGQEELMRDAWGRIAEVEGWVTRNAETGHATSVRRITNVRIVDDEIGSDYTRARGVLPFRSGDRTPEERLREAWDD